MQHERKVSQSFPGVQQYTQRAIKVPSPTWVGRFFIRIQLKLKKRYLFICDQSVTFSICKITAKVTEIKEVNNRCYPYLYLPLILHKRKK